MTQQSTGAKAMNSMKKQLLEKVSRLEQAARRGVQINEDADLLFDKGQAISLEHCNAMLKSCALFRKWVNECFNAKDESITNADIANDGVTAKNGSSSTSLQAIARELDTKARGDLICVGGFWNEIKRVAELNAIAAKEIGSNDDALLQWHQDRIKQILMKITSGKTQCAIRVRSGEWHHHL